VPNTKSRRASSEQLRTRTPGKLTTANNNIHQATAAAAARTQSVNIKHRTASSTLARRNDVTHYPRGLGVCIAARKQVILEMPVSRLHTGRACKEAPALLSN